MSQKVPIIMPQLGESIAEATVLRFLVEKGDTVEADQEIIEVETNKAVMGVTTPCAGVVESFNAEINEVYSIGAVLGYVTSDVAQPVAESASPIFETPKPSEVLKSVTAKTVTPLPSKTSGSELPVPQPAMGASFLSPRLRARMQQFGIESSELEIIPGSGIGGRVTTNDFENYLETLSQLPQQRASAMRMAVADSMRRSWSRPLATAGVAISLEPILVHRKGLQPSPGPALYVAKALATALDEHPQYAARIMGNKMVLPNSIDIGIAVEVEEGIMVPVIRKLNEKSLTDLAEDYQKLLEAAKARRLPEEAKEGAVASITNYGPLGITWAVPIPLPSETLIVGLGRGETRPVWDGTAFVPTIQADLTITFDHRVIDGGAAGRLLKRITTALDELCA
jgi:pyruvate/2-oxoglutarate dehydrogenase complex dihydrolipoamide acyltransferase (E2) component